MSFSSEGCHVVTGSDDQTIRIWDAETGTAVGGPLKGTRLRVVCGLLS